MCRSAGTQQTSMAEQIPVELDWIDDVAVHHRASETVTALPITLLHAFGEETNVMSLCHDDECDLRGDFKLLAGI